MGGTAPANQLRLSFTGSEDGEAATETCRAAKPLWRTTTRTSGPKGRNSLNRRMRTRLYGGVAGESGRPLPLCRLRQAFLGWESSDRQGSFEKVLLTPAIQGIKLEFLPSGPGNSSAERPPMTIKISKDPAAIALQERWERLRSHKRIISRVKLLVEWEQGGAKEHANAVTVDVSHSGCMAVVGADLPLHKRVRLIQQETGRKAEAEVVWRSHEAWDAGFELVKPDATFWGLR